MRVLGVHTYAGGFLRGLMDSGCNVVGSLETWEKPRLMAAMLGIKSVHQDDVGHLDVDMVVGNPPCSRFSNLSQDRYSDASRCSLAMFDELHDVIQAGIDSQAQIIWWENGPLVFSRGRELIADIHRKLRRRWGACSTFVVKFDLRHAGVPQYRPRTHVLHMVGNMVLPVEPPELVPCEVSVGSWVKSRAASFPLAMQGQNRVDDPSITIPKEQARHGFNACKPRFVDEEAAYAPTVLSGRDQAWLHENAWWSLADYAALQGYPVMDYTEACRAGRRMEEVRTFLSKSVSPCASAYIYEQVVKNITPTAVDLKGNNQVVYLRLMPPLRSKEE